VQAATRSKMDELHCRFENEPKPFMRKIKRFRTSLFSLLYCGVFVALNVIGSKQPAKLKSVEMTTNNKAIG